VRLWRIQIPRQRRVNLAPTSNISYLWAAAWLSICVSDLNMTRARPPYPEPPDDSLGVCEEGFSGVGILQDGHQSRPHSTLQIWNGGRTEGWGLRETR